MTLTLNLPHDDEQRLAQKAHAAGVDVQTFVERIVHAAATRPLIDDILRPIRDAFHASGMTDEELGDVLENAKHQMRTDRRSPHNS
ncbi:MAG TPA: hypothetical protein VFE58_13820 [Tepidisphaeraceae bacterium]|jgi:hypothetical protein|nr:hypothetical protein [Tepidisphaeraceae bacterium]